jgi:hypothetical protein
MSHTGENRGLQKSLQQEVSSRYNGASYMITAYYALPMTLSLVTPDEQQTECRTLEKSYRNLQTFPFHAGTRVSKKSLSNRAICPP